MQPYYWIPATFTCGQFPGEVLATLGHGVEKMNKLDGVDVFADRREVRVHRRGQLPPGHELLALAPGNRKRVRTEALSDAYTPLRENEPAPGQTATGQLRVTLTGEERDDFSYGTRKHQWEVRLPRLSLQGHSIAWVYESDLTECSADDLAALPAPSVGSFDLLLDSVVVREGGRGFAGGACHPAARTCDRLRLDSVGAFLLPPTCSVIARSREYLYLPDRIGHVATLGRTRLGLTVVTDTLTLQPGFGGHVDFRLAVNGAQGVALTAGIVIARITIEELPPSLSPPLLRRPEPIAVQADDGEDDDVDDAVELGRIVSERRDPFAPRDCW